MYSKWTTKEELLERLTKVNHDTDIKKSGIPFTYDDENLYLNDKDTHTMVIGSTGSGKTQTTVIPELRLAIKAQESFVLYDLKGEIYDLLSNDLEKEKYNIIKINLSNPTNGNSFNPLTLPYKLYKEGNKDRAIDIIENIGYYFLESEVINNNSDPFWTNSAISLFTGLTLYLFETEKEEDITINKIVSLMDELDNIKLDSFSKNSALYINLNAIIASPPETKASIIAVAKQLLKIFVTREQLSNLLSKTDFDISNIQKEKTAIFIISDNKASSNRLVSLIVDECYQAVMLNSNPERRLNILIDEFENTFRIKDFNNILTMSRSYNVRFNIYVKSLLELKNKYGINEYEILKLSFGNIIYLLANDIDTLEEVSKLCGKTKVNDKVEPLISIEELKLLNNFEAIILMPRMNPIKTKLIPDYQIKW